MSDLPPEIDTSRPHPARIYDYFIGGKNHFAADRETGEQVLRALAARAHRRPGEPGVPRARGPLPDRRGGDTAVP